MIFDCNKLTVLQLKEELKNRGLATTGAKAELVARMMEANPTGEGITHSVVDPCVENPASSDPSDKVRESQDSEAQMARREAEVLRQEKRLMERELELARREIAMLHQMQNLSVAESSQTRRESETSAGRTAHIKMGIDSIADLLNYFDGSGSAYDRWERQVILLKSTYELAEGECRVLIARRLKGRALEWLHSRPEFVRMTVDQLLTELRTTFHHAPSKATRRRLFDQRIWRKGETFSEYFHEKVILANHVPIAEDEMVDNIIDGIPDPVLRNQACIQRFETKTSLLAAFGKVSLQQPARTTDGQQEVKRPNRNEGNERSAIKTMPRSGNTKRCHSCGAKDHLIVNCPTKDKGVMCFECRGFGHMAANCPKKATKDACDVSQMTLNGKYYKETTVNGHSVKALVDTGSDLCLMRAGKYIEIGAPHLDRKKIMFRGVGSATNETLGEFVAKIEIDRNVYSIRVRVISDTLTQHDLIIGTDFLSTVDVTIREGRISVAKPKRTVEINTQTDVTDISNILPINYEVNEVDASYIANREHRTTIENMIQSYVPSYSLIARPLTNLLKSDVKFQFGEKEEVAFKQLKFLLSDKPVLRLYRVGAETELHTDASKNGYGAILLQRDSEDGALHPVFYASGKTTEAEENYSSYELEVLAIIKSLRKFRVYLLGICFKIITDCKAFSLTMKKADLCVRVARWVLLLEEFKYTIEHRSGKNMLHVDALSRSPLPSSLVIDEGNESLTARFKRAQGEDRDLKRIIDKCECQHMDGYVFRNGILYRESGGDVRLVVPKSMQTQIIRQAHERGHFSCNKTEMLLKRDYWFPNMQPKIVKAVKNCVSCILAERKQGRQEGLLHTIDKGEVPLDTLHIDHLGPIPSTKKSYRFVFVVVDAFSKFVWPYATKSTDAEEVICRLRKQAVIFGNPRRIISDRGSAFTSHAFRDYCKEENIEHIMITTGTPRGNGQVERVNRTLIPLLSKMAMPKPEEWYRYLDYAQKYLNSTHHRSIGTTPFNLLFGTHMRFKEDVSLREMIEKEWMMIFQEDREELRENAREEISKVQEENRRTYNRKRKENARYSEYDLVAIQRTQLKPGLKVSSKFLGPYEVIRILRNDRYIVRKVGEHEGPMETSTAADHMKLWPTNKDDVTSDEEDDDEQYDDRQDGDI